MTGRYGAGMTSPSPVPTVAVRGEHTREVDPELAEFAITVSARDKDRATTLARLSERVNATRAILDRYAAAIEKRETSRLSVFAQTRKGEKVSAYIGNATTTVTVTDFDLLGEMMIRIADQDQVAVAGPFWSVRPASPVHREARHAAIRDAITRAREYAEALGAHVTGLVELTDVGMSGGLMAPGGPAMFARAAGGGSYSGSPELNLDPQRQQISAQIEGRFQISEPTALDEPID
jgi:uncharacterized protein YggE